MSRNAFVGDPVYMSLRPERCRRDDRILDTAPGRVEVPLISEPSVESRDEALKKAYITESIVEIRVIGKHQLNDIGLENMRKFIGSQ